MASFAISCAIATWYDPLQLLLYQLRYCNVKVKFEMALHLNTFSIVHIKLLLLLLKTPQNRYTVSIELSSI